MSSSDAIEILLESVDVVFQQWWDAFKLKDLNIGSSEGGVVARQITLVAEGNVSNQPLDGSHSGSWQHILYPDDDDIQLTA